MNRLLVSVMASLLVAGGAQAAGDAAAGKEKAAVCVACHSADGNSVNPMWPKLAEQHSNYIVKQLQDFKSGARKDPLMSSQAVALTDDDMQNLAAYFSSQKVVIGQAAADQVEAGQLIYRGGNAETGVAACIACHGPTGSGSSSAKFPSISGQHADYVAKQLKAFSEGTRANDPASMMRNIAHNMSPEEMAAVAQYVQGLK